MYVIPFRGLKEGEHQFEYIINNTFFEVYQYEDILDADIKVHLNFIKKRTLLELSFVANGEVQVTCDISNELYFQPIEGSLDLVIKFGEVYNNDNETASLVSTTTDSPTKKMIAKDKKKDKEKVYQRLIKNKIRSRCTSH